MTFGGGIHVMNYSLRQGLVLIRYVLYVVIERKERHVPGHWEGFAFILIIYNILIIMIIFSG